MLVKKSGRLRWRKPEFPKALSHIEKAPSGESRRRFCLFLVYRPENTDTFALSH
jgi:hypothetical protein